MTTPDRQLKAIMFSDVKSFSAMMLQNEEWVLENRSDGQTTIRGTK